MKRTLSLLLALLMLLTASACASSTIPEENQTDLSVTAETSNEEIKGVAAIKSTEPKAETSAPTEESDAASETSDETSAPSPASFDNTSSDIRPRPTTPTRKSTPPKSLIQAKRPIREITAVSPILRAKSPRKQSLPKRQLLRRNHPQRRLRRKRLNPRLLPNPHSRPRPKRHMIMSLISIRSART